MKLLCECGAKLRIGDEHAGRKVKCPRCGARMRAPATVAPAGQPTVEVIEWPGPGATKSRPQVAAVGATTEGDAPAAGLPPPIEKPADDSAALLPLPPGESLSESQLLEFADGPAVQTHPAFDPSKVIVEGPDEDDVPTNALPRRRLGGKGAADVIAPPKYGFWVDALRSFIYPFATGGNLISFIITLILVGLGEFGSQFMWGPGLVVYGWTAALYMNIVADTCTGSDDLPGLKFEEGFFGDIIKPALIYFFCNVLVFLPAVGVGLLGLWNHVSMRTLLISVCGSLGIGAFLWPMVVMLFALGCGRQILRFDLMAATLGRAFLPYLAVWFFLLIGVSLMMMTSLGAVLFVWLLDMENPFEGFLTNMLLNVGVNLLMVYMTMVNMRVIGLYYRHFKRKFAYELE